MTGSLVIEDFFQFIVSDTRTNHKIMRIDTLIHKFKL